jgi:hypothetical protein
MVKAVNRVQYEHIKKCKHKQLFNNSDNLHVVQCDTSIQRMPQLPGFLPGNATKVVANLLHCIMWVISTSVHLYLFDN